MFELLDNPEAPLATPADHAAVIGAGRARLARRRLALGGSGVAVLLVIGFLAVPRSDGSNFRSVVDAADVPESTTPTTTTVETSTTTSTVPATGAAPTTTTYRAGSPTTTLAPTTTTTTAPPRIEPKATRRGELSVPPRPGVRLTLRLDRTAFSAGETLSGTLTLVNDSSDDVSIGPNACGGFHHGLYRYGEWVGGYAGHGCTGDFNPVDVAPGKTYEIVVEFDAYGDPSQRTRSALAPGVYQAAAGVYVFEREDQPPQAWFARSVDVEIR